MRKLIKWGLALPILLYIYYILPETIIKVIYPLQNRGLIGDFDISALHIPVYTILGFYLKWWALPIAVLAEVAHIWIPVRRFDLMDIAFNLIGAGVGIFLWKRVGKQKKRHYTMVSLHTTKP